MMIESILKVVLRCLLVMLIPPVLIICYALLKGGETLDMIMNLLHGQPVL